MRKILIISSVILLSLIAGVYYFFSGDKHNKSYFKDHSAFMAVPVKSPLVIEVNDVRQFFQEISGENKIANELMGFKAYADLYNEAKKLNELRKENQSFDKLLNGRSLVVSVNQTGKNELTCLFLSALKNESDINVIIDLIQNGAEKKFQLRKRAYDNATIYGAKSGEVEFFFAFNQGIFMASKNAILLEEAVRQSNTQNLLDNQGFSELYKRVSSSSGSNLYINHRTIYQVLTKLAARDLRRDIIDFSNFADWTEFDLALQPNDLILTGSTFSNDSNDNYLNVFKNQDPQRISFESILPFNTSFFLGLNLQSLENYFESYETYAKAHRQYYFRETDLINFQKEVKVDPVKLFNEVTTNEFVMAYTNINKSDLNENRFFIASLKNESLAKEAMLKVIQNYVSTNKLDIKSFKDVFGTLPEDRVEIYKFPYPDFAEMLFGRIFSGVKCNFFTIFDNHLIFGDSKFSLKKYLTDLRFTGSLGSNDYYQRFQQGISNRANIYMYADVSRVFYLKQLLFNGNINSILSENEEQVRHFHALGWQVANTGDMFWNKVYLRYDPEKKEEPQPIWQCKLDSTLAIKPVFVLNHRDIKNKEILVQDKKNNLYLINKDGNIKWKVQIPGRITSDIHQVDAYRNHKFQYLFNTRDKLFLLDINGNNVGKFPVSLRAEATNGVSVVDYDKSRNYRFFVACSDQNIYAYDRDGKMVKGWNPQKTTSPVKSPVKHVRLDGNDYLIYSDQNKTQFLNRRGEVRVNSSVVFDHSKNEIVFENGEHPRMISSDKSGSIYREYFDGRYDKKEIIKVDANHFFVPVDMNSDGVLEFIYFADKRLSVYTYDGRNVFNYEFSNPPISAPEVYQLASEKMIGITIDHENRVYLFNQNGALYNGFPVSGNSSFSIDQINPSNDYYSLIVGRENNILCNYRIE